MSSMRADRQRHADGQRVRRRLERRRQQQVLGRHRAHIAKAAAGQHGGRAGSRPNPGRLVRGRDPRLPRGRRSRPSRCSARASGTCRRSATGAQRSLCSSRTNTWPISLRPCGVSPRLAAVLGNGYLISPDVVVTRQPEPDDFINANDYLVDKRPPRTRRSVRTTSSRVTSCMRWCRASGRCARTGLRTPAPRPST